MSARLGWRLFTADLSGLSPELLDDADALESALLRELGKGVRVRRQGFVPRGHSLVGTGARVRFVLHTWPERGAATLDVWSDAADPERVVVRIANELSDLASRVPSSRAPDQRER